MKPAHIETSKLLPQQIEAEQSLLGCILSDPSVLPEVLEVIRGDEFYKDSHRLIFGAILDVFNHGGTPDLVVLADFLSSKGSLDAAGGASYLASLVDWTTTGVNARAYGKIISGKAVLRKLIQFGNGLVSQCYAGTENIREMIEQAETGLFQITQSRSRGQSFEMSEVVRGNLDTLQKLKSGKQTPGLPTQFTDLDRLMGGLQKSDLIILAARPGMGKTALALNIVANAAKSGKRCGFFSLEMSRDQIGLRVICSEARVDLHRARTGILTDTEYLKMTERGPDVSRLPIIIDDTAGLSALEVRARSRRMRSKGGLDLVIIDYLQLMAGKRAERREQEIAEVSRALKGLAKELHIPVIALSQLNRKLEERGDKRPIMSDLRESGALEQDADVVLFIYRDEVYERNSKDAGIAEVIVSKQRNGPTGTVKLAFIKSYTKFESLDL